MSELQYIRTDKNGTKYFNDWNCPRCGGAGESDKWLFTGRTCYACGGTGKRAKPLVIKEYTEKYAAKLAAKRRAREDAKPKPNEEEIRAIAVAAKVRGAKYNGINADGTGYAYEGNTYPIKDTIKQVGGEWIYGMWIAPKRIDAPASVTVTPIKAKYANGCWDIFSALKEANIF